MPDHIDFLSDEVPNQPFEVLITNPPYCLKYEFVEKCIRLGKPFALLLPMACMTTLKWYNKFSQHYFTCQILLPKVNFLHDGNKVQMGDIIWLYGNIGDSYNSMIYYNMKDVPVEESIDEGSD